ncbi:hypothetical protein Hbl1158_11785 [Halobaculum sp. CBA1158]|uniref:hypothetical protein n=1 Tax=Halobaculum sp. CBA1158 TaxID=2904243 RepID=UPI001F3F9144|nr:hypothetical protein [Halobaculum sp. CBA1158]UIO99207.1 hypothetical protein Hbl1158_11785 [Halobaculum sp. CBA1158]
MTTDESEDDGSDEGQMTTVDGRADRVADVGRADEHDDDALDRVANYMARELCAGFRYHDEGERDAAVESFLAVDRRQFAHLGDDRARRAAEGYVDALWAKDAVEDDHARADTLDADAVAFGDWVPVREALLDRADAVGMDRAYADATTRAWREHKSGGDYWTPMLRAQAIEYRAATGRETYPEKPSDGQSGYGAAPVRYLLGVELHDLHDESRWAEARRVMRPYYRRILSAHREE